jgi:hypothetical protein
VMQCFHSHFRTRTHLPCPADARSRDVDTGLRTVLRMSLDQRIGPVRRGGCAEHPGQAVRQSKSRTAYRHLQKWSGHLRHTAFDAAPNPSDGLLHGHLHIGGYRRSSLGFHRTRPSCAASATLVQKAYLGAGFVSLDETAAQAMPGALAMRSVFSESVNWHGACSEFRNE